MQIKSYFAILIGLSATFSCRCLSPPVRQMPQPDLISLRDDLGTLPTSDDFLPAVMQCLHYYTEMMQYELIQNPTPKPTFKPTTTTKRPQTTTPTTKRTTTQRATQRTTSATTTRRTTPRQTTRKPLTTPRPTYYTEINIWHNPPTTPRPHKPGHYAPDKPPYYMYFGTLTKPEQGSNKPGAQRPQDENVLSEPNWKDPAFIQWFFQPKPKEIEPFDENELQYLDPLPKKLLLEIHREPALLPAILDLDNVNEFRKKYDDSFYPRYRNNVPNMQHMRMKIRIQMQQQRPMLTGKKKPPPTRPYVHMLMLYDLLKREAKSKKLQQFGGFSPELLKKLHESSRYTGDYQMLYLLETMLEHKEVTAADVLTRVNFIISDLKDEKSDTFKTLRIIPPLYYAL